jgi:hypothetical protein
MNIPGFTAQVSLYLSHKYYQAHASIVPNQQVIPQAINRCWVISYTRTYNRCRGLGYGHSSCGEVAEGVADTACV